MRYFLLLSVTLTGLIFFSHRGDAGEKDIFAGKIPAEAGNYVAPGQIGDALFGVGKPEKWNPQTNDEVSRGSSAAVYAKAGPAVVLIRLPNGHGTGFLIDKEGWIITNQHVAAAGSTNLDAGNLVVNVHFGRYKDRLIELDPTSYPAEVYKVDEQRDLALLRLVKKPAYLDEIQPIAMAQQTPAPGDDCIAIGHPALGTLWTVRSGEVSGIGNWPNDRIGQVLAAITSAGDNGAAAAKSLQASAKRKIVLSSCGINPGDSGGPLLNSKGELIAVTYGIPRGGGKDEISLDKFSYHVHLDELKAFLKDRPEAAQVNVPSPWAPALFGHLLDNDNDGRWDLWIFAMSKTGKLSGKMFDLDQDTKPAFKEQYITDPVRREGWDFEFAMTFGRALRTFYDTDNDGAVDAILTDVNDDMVADLVLQKKDGKWLRVAVEKQRMLDPNLFKDLGLQSSMAKVLSKPGK